jgi:hypothetical protein
LNQRKGRGIFVIPLPSGSPNNQGAITMTNDELQITIIGAGHGGKTMAADLAARGFAVRLYNRTTRNPLLPSYPLSNRKTFGDLSAENLPSIYPLQSGCSRGIMDGIPIELAEADMRYELSGS